MTTPVEQKNGDVVLETHFVRSAEAPDPMAEPVPRLPRFGEHWEGRRFVKNKKMIADHAEEARLNLMSRRELVEEMLRLAAAAADPS